MVKGEDAIIRKKNKSNRKKLRSESAKVSNRIAAIIAQKKRRQSGKRRMCQGMCFSLPTPENPFNEKSMILDSKKKAKTKKTKKIRPSKGVEKLSEKGSDASQNKRKANIDHPLNGKEQGQKRARVEKESPADRKGSKKPRGHVSEGEGCPSNFLISCLKTIQDTMHHNESFEPGRPLFFDPWGFEFWRCYSNGRNVLETSGGCSTMEQIAWIVSAAIDTFTKKENEGVSFTGPFLLFLVPSQEKATEVRAVCKSLKSFGIHTVSLHPGASIDHQIHGLKACDPEFLICTPDRLLELISMEAIDISGVCSLIVDGLESFSGDAYFDSIKSIRQHISVDPHTVVFCSDLSEACLSSVSSLLPSPVCRLSREDSIVNQSAGIIQSLDVVGSAEEKLQKGLQVVHEVFSDPVVAGSSKLTFVVGKDEDREELVSAIRSKGYSVSMNGPFGDPEPEVVNGRKEKEGTVCVIDFEDLEDGDLSQVEVVIIYNFDTIGMVEYKNILTGMARYTIKGRLHVILNPGEGDAAALAQVLEQCGQQVPEPLKQLSLSS